MSPRGAPPPDEPSAGEKPATPHHAGHRDRLRQRLLSAGPDSLADYELLEVLLFGPIPRRDVKPLAKKLLSEFGSLGAVLAAEPKALEQRGGLKTNAIAALKASAATAHRLLREQASEAPVIGSWHRLLDYLGAAMKFERAEQFRLLYLDRKNKLIADEVQQRGTIDHAPVYPREVVKRALDLGASAVILVHNHPSGDPTPSEADIAMTRDVKRALATVDIDLFDHVIVAKHGNESLRSRGLL